MQTVNGMRAKYERLYSNGLIYLARGEMNLGEKYLTEAAANYKEYFLSLGSEERAEAKEWFLELCAHIKALKTESPERPSRGELKEGEGKESFAFSKSEIPKVSLDDVVGLEDVKAQIYDMIIYPKEYSELYELFNKKLGGGILLYGPPGNGKTMIAKAIAHKTDSVFYPIKFSDLGSKWFSETEGRIKALFDEARSQPSAVIFFDEIDAIASKREDSGVADRVVCELLTQIDGINKGNGNLTVIAATNRPEALDPAILRPGRFDEKIYIPLPDIEARSLMLEKRLKGIPCSVSDFRVLAELCEGFSGAEIELACEKAKQTVIREIIKSGVKDRKITKKDLIDAIQSIKSK